MRMSPGGIVGVGVLVGMGVGVLSGIGVGVGVLVGMGVGVLSGVGVGAAVVSSACAACVSSAVSSAFCRSGALCPHAIRAIWAASRSATAAPAASEVGPVALLRGERATNASCSWGTSKDRRMIVGSPFGVCESIADIGAGCHCIVPRAVLITLRE